MKNTGISRERLFCQAALLGVAYGAARYRNIPITRQGALPFAFSTIFQLGSLHLKGSPNKKTYVNLLSVLSFALMADGLRKLDMPVRSKVLSGGLLGGAQLVIVNYSSPPMTAEEWKQRLDEIYFEKFSEMYKARKLLEKKKQEFDLGLFYQEPQTPKSPQRFWQLYDQKLVNNEFPDETPEEFWDRFQSEEIAKSVPSILSRFIHVEEDFQYLSEVELPEDQTGDLKLCKITRFRDLSIDKKEPFKSHFIDLISRTKDTRLENTRIYLSKDQEKLYYAWSIPSGKMEGVYLCKSAILLISKNREGELLSSNWNLDFHNYVFDLNQVETSFDPQTAMFNLAIKVFQPVGPAA